MQVKSINIRKANFYLMKSGLWTTKKQLIFRK